MWRQYASLRIGPRGRCGGARRHVDRVEISYTVFSVRRGNAAVDDILYWCTRIVQRRGDDDDVKRASLIAR